MGILSSACVGSIVGEGRMTFLVYGRVSFLRKLRRMPMRKGPISGYWLFDRQETVWRRERRMKTVSWAYSFYLWDIESFRKQKGREGRNSWQRGLGNVHRPGNVLLKSFFLGPAMGQHSKSLGSAGNSSMTHGTLLLYFQNSSMTHGTLLLYFQSLLTLHKSLSNSERKPLI